MSGSIAGRAPTSCRRWAHSVTCLWWCFTRPSQPIPRCGPSGWSCSEITRRGPPTVASSPRRTAATLCISMSQSWSSKPFDGCWRADRAPPPGTATRVSAETCDRGSWHISCAVVPSSYGQLWRLRGGEGPGPARDPGTSGLRGAYGMPRLSSPTSLTSRPLVERPRGS